MSFINKKFIIGFAAGFVAFPILFVCLGYVYLIFNKSAVDLNPPNIDPVEHAINLDWDVKTLGGETINLKNQFKGKAVFLNFWATWCPPCTQEMPGIESLYRKFNGKVGFTCISNESISDLQKYKDSKGYTMPIYHLEGNAPRALNIKGIPVTYIISSDRKSSFKHIGGADWAHENVIAYFEKMLKRVE
jgi:thiol-disulfide isomerase/thioredoxin